MFKPIEKASDWSRWSFEKFDHLLYPSLHHIDQVLERGQCVKLEFNDFHQIVIMLIINQFVITLIIHLGVSHETALILGVFLVRGRERGVWGEGQNLQINIMFSEVGKDKSGHVGCGWFAV